jgi:hypothetical protein
VALEPRPRRLLRPQLQQLTGAPLVPSSWLQGMVSSVLRAIMLSGIAEIDGSSMNE